MEVNEECGLTDTASSSDEDDTGVCLSMKAQFKQPVMKLQGVLDCSLGQVQYTFAPRPETQAHPAMSASVVGSTGGMEILLHELLMQNNIDSDIEHITWDWYQPVKRCTIKRFIRISSK